MSDLLLGILVGAQRSNVSDEEFAKTFHDKELATASLKSLLFLSVIIFTSILLILFTKEESLLSWLGYIVIALAILPFIGCLYFYLRHKIVSLFS
ncbi:MAG: hypothetical protein JSS64_07100 [Bacteroidetes bacterium]|nr:hypothetical protein [Bacteroidota bacterium]